MSFKSQLKFEIIIYFLSLGGTGFLGKILIEKLLRSCPNVSTIYLLVRPKKEKNIENRMQELFEDPVSQNSNSQRIIKLKDIIF